MAGQSRQRAAVRHAWSLVTYPFVRAKGSDAQALCDYPAKQTTDIDAHTLTVLVAPFAEWPKGAYGYH